MVFDLHCCVLVIVLHRNNGQSSHWWDLFFQVCMFLSKNFIYFYWKTNKYLMFWVLVNNSKYHIFLISFFFVFLGGFLLQFCVWNWFTFFFSLVSFWLRIEKLQDQNFFFKKKCHLQSLVGQGAWFCFFVVYCLVSYD